MNEILLDLQKENEITLSKYMNQPNMKYYNQFFNMKSIIKKNLENESPIPLFDEKKKNGKEKSPSYHPGGIKKNRIKCYQELNIELLKEEERKKRIELEEKKKREKQKIDPKLLEKFFKRNEEELLENILRVNEKLLTPVTDIDDDDSIYKKSELDVKKGVKEDLPVNIKQLYIFGNNFSDNGQNINNNNFFIYHKKDRWICFPNSDCVLIDQYVDDISSGIDLKKNQVILKQHKNKSYINSIKISQYGAVIYFKNDDKYIIFYKYDYQKKKFEYISEVYVDYKEVINEYIVDQNEAFCIVIYDNYNILIIDFVSNDEVINTKVDYLVQNQFCGMILNNYTEYKIEFCLYSVDSYVIYNLKYIGEIKLKEKKYKYALNLEQKKITSVDFLPPLGYTTTLCLLVAFEDKSVYLINCDTNTVIYKFAFEFVVNKIIATLFFINFISNTDIIFYKISNPKNINIDDIKSEKYKMFDDKIKRQIKHASRILCADLDLYDPDGSALVFTERGMLYYDFYPERKKIKLYGFTSEDKYINNCVIINNYNSDINEIKKVSHYIVTGHNQGGIKIYTLPSFDIIYEFREKNDEISYMISIPGKPLFVSFYKSGLMKCFDIHKCRFTGIINILGIIGNEENQNNFVKYAKFYPDGRFCLIVDSAKNNLYVLTFDKIDPLNIKCKPIPFIQINGLTNIIINKIEPFLTFAIVNNYNEVYVYERKYASLIKTLNLENDTPFYQKKDYIDFNKLNLAEYKFVEYINQLQNVDKINQNECYYGLANKNRERERHYLYIFNYKLNALFVRDTKAKDTIDAIQLNIPVYNLMFEHNLQDYIIIMDKNGLQKVNIDDLTFHKKKYNGIEWLPSLKKYNDICVHKLVLSDEEKIIIIINNNCYNIYLITE